MKCSGFDPHIDLHQHNPEKTFKGRGQTAANLPILF
jgi:hypothetical protein